MNLQDLDVRDLDIRIWTYGFGCTRFGRTDLDVQDLDVRDLDVFIWVYGFERMKGR